jgi:hypothetical protein
MRAIACLIILCSLALAGTDREVVVTGEVSDSQCAFNVHSSGNSHDDVIKTGVLGHTPEECTRSCVRLGGKYVLVDGVHKKVYHVANPALVEAFAAQKVRVKAMLGANDVLSITSVEPL